MPAPQTTDHLSPSDMIHVKDFLVATDTALDTLDCDTDTQASFDGTLAINNQLFQVVREDGELQIRTASQ